MSERTPEERDAARQERMRRRGAGDAAPAPPAGADGAGASPDPGAQEPPLPPAEPPPSPPAAPSPPSRPALPERPLGTIPPPGAGAAAEPPAPRRRSPGRHALLVGLLVAAAAVIVFLVVAVFEPFKGDGGQQVRVRIPAGLGAGGVGDLLAERGVVSSGLFFEMRATITGKRGDLRSGTYVLREGMGNGAALAVLTDSGNAAPVIGVVVPEGPSRREVAPVVARQGVKGDYLQASVSSPLLNPRRYGAPASARSLEGFLYPATYELLRSRPEAKLLVDKQLRAFKDAFGTVNLSYARSKNLTAYDVLTIASMIERETSVASERRLVSAVIYNRLRESIPLGIDATTRYAVDNWDRPLTSGELRSTSPYNTRNRQGLPPGPIGNPGLASIKAAARPASVDYLYYVVAPCRNGAHAFSTTDAQFQEDVAAYNAKRAELGGRDPKVCPK
ncbi:MAG: endolytic transglycosylase MltG [Solirubrobacterales bacterium]